jgi:UDP-glucose 4-epimerase
MERILSDLDRAHGFKFTALRYFNAAGAIPGVGEDHHPESHLIPTILKVALGQGPLVQIFGQDYPTPDGTAIRDYIHVADLGAAHILALDYLRKGGPSEFLNLGTGKGYSVQEVITKASQITKKEIPVRIAPRREGDPARLVAQAQKARKILGWAPENSSLDQILQSAWDWHREHPKGYV